ncbi:C39 family peptidase [Arthrospiribacter ruber]|uniref:Uncharacterized protein n=1 Tax=Arthrospiribacter ruber TaxID=2487934 RepID=A0A951IUN6_9BACT|nr:C39 family peptidase [Arthrospiribacter ruber]MBW3467505.1 hypothetical protein [Arthrospiribacter ruber]
MYIEKNFTRKENILELLSIYLSTEYQIDNETAQNCLKKQLTPLLDQLIENIVLLIEYPYTDKVFRDSFYNYFSSKLYPYYRDCIRVSLFSDKVSEEDFRDSEQIEKVKSNFLGFFVIRPITPQLLGRTAISPKAYKNNNLLICKAPIPCAINGIKMTVEAFPYSSQDAETISCAETTLWAVMEYFGIKYPEYKPTLPSKIHDTLKKVSFERQIPSNGLDILQLSFALKEFGFGTRIYSKDQFGDQFLNLLAIYMESGIPIILSVSSEKIGHAVVCIGREANDFDNLIFEPSEIIQVHGTPIIFNSHLERKYVFIDDNHPPYQLADLKKPFNHYKKPDWEDCQISHFIVPLYSKVYLEAYEAKNFIIKFLNFFYEDEIKEVGDAVFIRIFLTSSRSFKNEIAINKTWNKDIKEIVLESLMPKFIWVAEFSTQEKIKKHMAEGLIILDATEANIYNNKPLILSVYQKKMLLWDENNNELVNFPMELNDFCIYKNNLGGF